MRPGREKNSTKVGSIAAWISYISFQPDAGDWIQLPVDAASGTTFTMSTRLFWALTFPNRGVSAPGDARDEEEGGLSIGGSQTEKMSGGATEGCSALQASTLMLSPSPRPMRPLRPEHCMSSAPMDDSGPLSVNMVNADSRVFLIVDARTQASTHLATHRTWVREHITPPHCEGEEQLTSPVPYCMQLRFCQNDCQDTVVSQLQATAADEHCNAYHSLVNRGLGM